MSINQELDILYKQRQSTNEHFVGGGVIDESTFDSCEVKILMLLKEVNDIEQKDNWSLVQLIHDQIENLHFYPVWKRVGEWSFGLQQGFPAYQKIVGSSKEANITKGLFNIATTNLKKSGGSGESNHEVIKKDAEDYKDLWTQEIQIIKPDVVICGGTFSIVQDVLGFDYSPCGSGANVGKAMDVHFVDFYHPMYRISPKVLYAYFKETMRALRY